MRKMSQVLGFEIKNIYFKNVSINEEHLQKLNSLLNVNLNLKEIKFDFTKNLGINAFTQPIKKVKENGDLAELIGILLGDGNIWHNCITIAFDKRNKKYMNYVKKLFDDIFGIKLKTKAIKETNQGYLYCYNQFVTQKLLDFGLKRGDKIKNNLEIPEWIKRNKSYCKRCMRGLIDTDGCIYLSKRDKQLYIEFTNFNEQLLKDFKNLTIFLGYNFAKANKNNWCLYRKFEVVRFIKDIKPLRINGGHGEAWYPYRFGTCRRRFKSGWPHFKSYRKMKKFVVLPDGEKVKLYKGKIRFKDRAKVIPGGDGVKKLREDIKRLRLIKIDYSKLK